MTFTLPGYRNSYLFALVSMIAFCSVSCGGGAQLNEEVNKDTLVIRLEVMSQSGWAAITLMAFIDTLAKYKGEAVFMVKDDGPPSDWFDTTYIPLLTARLNDTTPSAVIFSVYENNSHTPLDISTVGCQAKYLLESYTERRYPRNLCSYHGGRCAE